MVKPKIVVIVGPTGAGKTELSVFLAKKFGGEVVSADSRQVYRELTIGTAKPEGKWQMANGTSRYVSHGVVHYLIDEIDPREEFNLPDFQKRARGATQNILTRGKLPIVAGGTGQYIYALLENWLVPEVRPNPAFRARMEKFSAEELLNRLEGVEPDAARATGKNKRRLVRALEVHESLGSLPRRRGPRIFDALIIGIPVPKNYEEILRLRIEKMLKNGLRDEVRGLVKKYGWSLPAMQSIGYQEFKEHLAGKETVEEAVEQVARHTKEFSRRQMVWFKRDEEIRWVANAREAERLVAGFL